MFQGQDAPASNVPYSGPPARGALAFRSVARALTLLLSGLSLAANAWAWTGPPIPLGAPPVRNDSAGQVGFAELAAYPGGQIAVFEDCRESSISCSIYAVRYDSSGNRLDPTGLRVTADLGNLWDPAVACLGTSCLVVWERVNVGAQGQLFAADLGTTQGPVWSLVPGGSKPGVAARPGGYVVLSNSSAGVVSRAISGTGAPVGSPTTIAAGQTAWDNPLVLVGSAGLLGAWYENTGAVRTVALDTNGVPTAAVRTLTTTTVDAYVMAPLSGIWDGSRFVLSWSGPGGLYVQRLDPAGVPLDAAPVRVLNTTDNLDATAIAFDGSHYLVTWSNLSFDDAHLMPLDVTTLAPAGPAFRLGTFQDANALSLGWSAGTGLLLAEEFGGTIEATTRAFTLTLAPDAGVLVSAPDGGYAIEANSAEHGPRGVWTGADYAVAWWGTGSGRGQVSTRRLSPLGAPLTGIVPLTDGGALVRNPFLGFDGQGVHVLWHGGPPTTALGTGLWWRGLDAAAGPLRIVNNLRYDPPGAVVSFGGISAAVWSGEIYGQGWEVRGAQLPADGGVPAGSVQLAAQGGRIHSGTAGSSNTQGLACWVESPSEVVRWARLTPGLALQDPPQSQGAPFAKNLAVGSDGRDFLIAYAQEYTGESIQALRISEAGTRLGPGPVQVAPSNPLQQGESLTPSVAFDGTAYRVAYEVPGDAGVQIWWRRVWSDGGMAPPERLVSGASAEKPWLVQGTPGRLLILWEQWVPATQTRAVFAMPWAEVEPGNPCQDSVECRIGVCSAGTCCDPDAGACDGGPATLPDGGPATLPDGGTPPGTPLRLAVGCGCGAGAWGSGGLLALLLLSLAARRRARG